MDFIAQKELCSTNLNTVTSQLRSLVEMESSADRPFFRKEMLIYQVLVINMVLQIVLMASTVREEIVLFVLLAICVVKEALIYLKLALLEHSRMNFSRTLVNFARLAHFVTLEK